MTHSPSFPVEKQLDRLRRHELALKDKAHVAEILRKAVFPNAESHDAMSMLRDGVVLAWRPNNYRLKIPVKTSSSGNLTSMEVAWGGFPVEFSSKSTGSIKVSDRITLLVQPNSVTGIYSLKGAGGFKEWYDVRCSSVSDFDSWLDGKVSEIEALLLVEVHKLGLPLDYANRGWIRHEDGVKGEEFLDSLPENLVIHDTYFKKVYKDETEFKSPAYVKNYIANRAVESVIPEVMKKLDAIELGLPGRRLAALKAEIKVFPTDVLTRGALVESLSLPERVDLTDWLFCKFGNEVLFS